LPYHMLISICAVYFVVQRQLNEVEEVSGAPTGQSALQRVN